MYLGITIILIFDSIICMGGLIFLNEWSWTQRFTHNASKTTTPKNHAVFSPFFLGVQPLSGTLEKTLWPMELSPFQFELGHVTFFFWEHETPPWSWPWMVGSTKWVVIFLRRDDIWNIWWKQNALTRHVFTKNTSYEYDPKMCSPCKIRISAVY